MAIVVTGHRVVWVVAVGTLLALFLICLLELLLLWSLAVVEQGKQHLLDLGLMLLGMVVALDILVMAVKAAAILDCFLEAMLLGLLI